MQIEYYCPNCKKRFPVSMKCRNHFPKEVHCVVCGYKVSLVNALADIIRGTIVDLVKVFFVTEIKAKVRPEMLDRFTDKDVEALTDAYLSINVDMESKNKVYKQLDESQYFFSTSETYKILAYGDAYETMHRNVKRLISLANMGNPYNMMI